MKPQNSLILVEVEEEKEKTTVTGVIIPTTVEDKAISSLRIGTVIAINRKEEEEKDIKVGDEVWCMTKYSLSNHCVVFMPYKVYITSMNTTTLFCGNGFHRVKLNKSEYKTLFFLTKEECIEACNICTRKSREQNAM